MIRMMTIDEREGGTRILLFKLSNSGRPGQAETLPLEWESRGLGKNVMRVLGYTERTDGMFIPVERHRFELGPIYMQVTLNAQNRVTKVQRFSYKPNGTVEVLPLPELVEV
jgi:hypothetical protein